MGLYLLIPVSVVIVFVIGVIFWWSVRSGQFDDLEGPAYRLLLDDKDPVPGERTEEAGQKGGEEESERDVTVGAPDAEEPTDRS